MPDGHLVRPRRWRFRESGKPGAHILLPLGVVGRQRGHAGRPVVGDPPREAVKLRGAAGRVVGIGTYLVGTDQPGPAVGSGVLDALSLDGRASLLEPDDQFVSYWQPPGVN